MRLIGLKSIVTAICLMLMDVNSIVSYSHEQLLDIESASDHKEDVLRVLDPVDETVEVVRNVSVPNPKNNGTKIESAPSITLAPNRTYNVQWEIPQHGEWAIVISKLTDSTNPQNAWKKYQGWTLHGNTGPRRIVSSELGNPRKCLITVWEAKGGIFEKSDIPAAAPYSESSQSTANEQGTNIKRFTFEFKFPAYPNDIIRVTLSGPMP